MKRLAASSNARGRTELWQHLFACRCNETVGCQKLLHQLQLM